MLSKIHVTINQGGVNGFREVSNYFYAPVTPSVPALQKKKTSVYTTNMCSCFLYYMDLRGEAKVCNVEIVPYSFGETTLILDKNDEEC